MILRLLLALGAVALAGQTAHAQAPSIDPQTCQIPGACIDINRALQGVMGGDASNATLPAAQTNLGLGALAQHSEISVMAPPPGLSAAKCDWNGTAGTDDTAAIQAMATAYPTSILTIPSTKSCYSATGLSFTTSVGLAGSGVSSPGFVGQAQGATIVCAQAVVTCIQSISPAAPPTTNLNIEGASASPLSGSTCIRQSRVYNIQMQGVRCANFYNAFYFGSSVSTSGISVHADKLFACNITGNYFVFDGWPEGYVENGREGCNGGPNPTANAYVLITGGSTTNASGGPNTLHFNNNQFNGSAAYFLSFENQLPASIADTGYFNFYNNHIEGITTGYIHSDSTWATLSRVQLSANSFNSVRAFWALDAATHPSRWDMTGNLIACSDFSLGPSGGMRLVMVGNDLTCGGTITGAGTPVASIVGNTFGGDVTLTGAWSSLIWSSAFTGSFALTNTATGSVIAQNPGGPSSFTTPYSGGQLVLGGAAQSGLLNLARGSDGAVHASLGFNSASDSNHLSLTNDSGSSIITVNSASSNGTILMQTNSLPTVSLGPTYGSQFIVGGTGSPGGRIDFARTSDGVHSAFVGSCVTAGGDQCFTNTGGSPKININAQNTSGVISLQVGTGPTLIQQVTASGTALAVAGSDATHTDATVCRDTTSGLLYAGSGTLGICLGTSSLRFKTNVAPLDAGLADLMNVQTISYRYKPGYGGAGEKYGFSAENIAKVMPKLAAYDAEGKPNAVDWAGIVPVLVNAVQQQQREINALKRRARH